LGQVLINLVGNAIKFTEKGSVVVRVERSLPANGQVLEPDEQELLFSVTDSGIGIDPDQMESLFSPFTQLDSSVTRQCSGTGLGLSICRRLVELMRGRIWVESEPRRGSRFFFTVVVRLQATCENRGAPGVPARGLKVLVVDDNETARVVLREMLESLECNVTTASSASEALCSLHDAALEHSPYALVFADWKMPRVDGTELIRSIRGDPLLQEDSAPKLVLITMYCRDEVSCAHAIDALGVDAFVVKPASASELFDAMVDALGAEGPGGVRRRNADGGVAHAEALNGIRGARLLVVEDNLINQQVAEALLESVGFNVALASNGKEAVRMLGNIWEGEAVPFDAILMDLQMPVMSGLEATRIIRQDLGLTGLPIIAMTAHAFESDQRECLAAGMNDYVAKPIDEDQLFAMLSKWIRPVEKEQKQERAEESPGTSVPDKLPLSLPGIDVAGGLCRLRGDARLYVGLLHDFREKYEDYGGRMRLLFEEGEFGEAKRVAHAIRGASGNLGAQQLSTSAAALETEFAHGASAATPALLDSFSRQMSVFVDSAKRIEARQCGAVGMAVRVTTAPACHCDSSVSPLLSSNSLTDCITLSSSNFDTMSSAPAARADSRYRSTSCPVTTRMYNDRSRCFSLRISSIPSMPGREMSTNATSGSKAGMSSSASSAVSLSPIAEMKGKFLFNRRLSINRIDS
jgi:two-component system, sensor histidine kinase and response regulator